MNELSDALRDITQSQDAKWWHEKSEQHLEYLDSRQPCGPNRWSEVTRGDFGRFYDFEVVPRRNGQKVFRADSEAALQWCYRFLPEDCPRYEVDGFIIDWDIDAVILEAERHGLVDRATAERIEADSMAGEQ